MIVEIINKIADKRKEVVKLKSILTNFNLPKKYRLNIDDLCITYGFLRYKIATLNITDDIIEDNFDKENESDLEFLRKYFEESKIKFKLIIGDFYY